MKIGIGTFLGRALGPSDIVAPTVAISSSESSPSAANPVSITITFSEEVVGFTSGDVTLDGAVFTAISNFLSFDNIVWTADLTVSASGTGTVDIGAAVCQDLFGNDNQAASQFSLSVAYWPTAHNGDVLTRWEFDEISTLFQDIARTTPATTGDQPVGGVTDLGPVGNHAQQTTDSKRMILIPDQKTGKIMLRAGLGKFLQSASSLARSQPYTVYLVMRQGFIGTTQYDRLLDLTNAFIYVDETDSGKIAYYAGTVRKGTGIPGTDYVLIEAVFNGASSRLKLNGNIESTELSPGTGGATTLLVGYTTSSPNIYGYYGAAIVTTTQHDEIYNYLYAKWAMVSVTAPASIGTVVDQGEISDAGVNGVYVDNGAIYFDQSKDAEINLFTAALSSNFNPDLATCIIRLKAGNWSEATQKDIIRLDFGSTPAIWAIDHPVSSTNLRAYFFPGSSGARYITVDCSVISDFFTFGMTVDVASNVLKAYLSGSDQGAYTGTSPLNSSETGMAQARVGNAINVPIATKLGYPWLGWISDVILSYGVVSSDGNMSVLDTKLTAGSLVASDLNSVFGVAKWSWWKNDSIVYGS